MDRVAPVLAERRAVGGDPAASADGAHGTAARGRPAGDQRGRAPLPRRLPMACAAAGIRALHDGLQPLEPLEPARHLASHLCRPRRLRRPASGHADRQFRCEGAPLGGWREKGGEGDACHQAIGRSRGGRTTKIHALCDEQGRPHAILPTGGNVADITAAATLVSAVTPSGELVATRATTPTTGVAFSPRAAPPRSSPAPRRARRRSRTTSSATGCATSSSAPSAVSRISAASPPDTTRPLATSSPPSASSPPSPTGRD